MIQSFLIRVPKMYFTMSTHETPVEHIHSKFGLSLDANWINWIRPIASAYTSPDIEGIDLGITADEIVAFIAEGRRYS
jgi:hypothetical protein